MDGSICDIYSDQNRKNMNANNGKKPRICFFFQIDNVNKKALKAGHSIRRSLLNDFF